jgi:hypothetical protein
MYNIVPKTGSTAIRGVPWVSHGFTDSSLSSFPNGDMQWSLCVTCGAWMANHIFEWLIFEDIASIDSKILSSKVLPIYRGILLFFQDYLFQSSHLDDQGNRVFVTHSGPTTSPENSYILNIGNSILQPLCLSPSIDISILRQVEKLNFLSFSLLMFCFPFRLPTSGTFCLKYYRKLTI